MFKKNLSLVVGVVAFMDEAVVAGLARTYPSAKCAALIFRGALCHRTSSPLNLWISSPQQVRLASSGPSRHPHFAFP